MYRMRESLVSEDHLKRRKKENQEREIFDVVLVCAVVHSLGSEKI